MFDENDLLDEDVNLQDQQVINTIDDEPSSESEFQESQLNDPEFIDSVLNRLGISDKNQIKFEDESGPTTKRWDELDTETKIGILTNQEEPENGLDDEEIRLINEIRMSKMSPNEYRNYIIQQGIGQYLNTTSTNIDYKPHYQVDDIEDDVLYIADILAKVGEENVTNEELEEMLANAKTNPTLFQKQVQAIRQSYKNEEDSQRNAENVYQQEQRIGRYNQFAESVENSIRNFTNISGMDLDMSEDEMEELYDFIVGFDKAGASTFGKVLNNPYYLVKMGWFALHGDQMLADLNDSFNVELQRQKEISYKKGLEDGKSSKGSSLYINNKNNKYSIGDLLDHA